MPARSDHIVKSFDEDLNHLRDDIVRMGGMAEAQLAGAIGALSRRNADEAQEIIENDALVDDLEQQINDRAVRMIALRQPMADDLRRVLTALKIASDLERIGDYAKNVAKRVIVLSQLPPVKLAGAIPRMARLVQDIIKQILDAYVADDPNRAMQAWRRDEEVDEMYTGLFRELLTYMMEDPRNITPCTHLLFIAKNIERMGDHATNIAEDIHYLVLGERIEGGRPKGDRSSFEIVTPEEAETDAEPAGTPSEPKGDG